MLTPVSLAARTMWEHNCQSLLEIGCGKGGIIAQFPVNFRVGIDHYLPYLQYAQETYSGVLFMHQKIESMMDLFLPKLFDCVIGFDILEHLPYDVMVHAIDQVEEIAKKLVIFFSPPDEIGLQQWPEDVDNNPSMKHVTIIREALFQERGYSTIIYPDYHGKGINAMLAIKEL